MTATVSSRRKLVGLRRAAFGMLAAFFLLATGFLTTNSTRPVAAATPAASSVPTNWSATLIPAASDAYPGLSITYGAINNHGLTIEDYYDLNFDPISNVLDLTNPVSPSRLTYDGIPAVLNGNLLTDYGLSQILNDNQTVVGSFGEANPASDYEILDPQSFSYSCQLSDCAETLVVYPDPFTYSDPADAIAYSNLLYINNNNEAAGADGVFTPPDTVTNTPFIANENTSVGTAQNLTSSLPCANNATPLVLNDKGVVGGTISNGNAFIWIPPASKCTILTAPSSEPSPGKITLAVTSINNNGLAAVTACDNTLSLSCRGYLYNFSTSLYVALAGTSFPLTIPGQNESFANGITAANVATMALNDADWILVGYYYPDSDGNPVARGAVLIPNNSPTPTPSASPSPTFTPTASPTATTTNVAPTPTPVVTPAPTPAISPVPSATASSTPTPITTPSTSATPTPAPTASVTPSPTSSPTSAGTPTPISTPIPIPNGVLRLSPSGVVRFAKVQVGSKGVIEAVRVIADSLGGEHSSKRAKIHNLSLDVTGLSFTELSTTCRPTLAMGHHCIVKVVFKPANFNPQQGALVVHAVDSANSPAVVLTGRAKAPPRLGEPLAVP